jgi:hypothetical protein
MDVKMTIEQAAEALHGLLGELDATHAAPFSSCFLVEHWAAIESAMDFLVNGSQSLRVHHGK